MINIEGHSESNYRRFLKKGQRSAENLYKTYNTLMRSPLLQVGRESVARHLPLVARCFLILEGPSTFLQIAPLAGAAHDALKLRGYLKSPKTKQTPLQQLACKILYTSGSLINNTLKVSLAAETFQWTTTLASKGFKLTSSVLKTTASYSKFLGVAVWIFSLPKLLDDYSKIEKSRLSQRNFENLASWSEATNLFSTPGTLNRVYRIQQEKLNDIRGRTEQEKLETLKRSLQARAESHITCRKLKLLVDLTGLVASAIIFTSFLSPVGFGLLGMQAAFSMSLTATQKVAQYRLDHDLGFYTAPETSDGRVAQLKHIAQWAYHHR